MPDDDHTAIGDGHSTSIVTDPVLETAEHRLAAPWLLVTSLTIEQPGATVCVPLLAVEPGPGPTWATRHFDPAECRSFGEALLRAADQSEAMAA